MELLDPEREEIIHDGLEPCPYLPERVARMPLRRQLRELTPEEFDESLAGGDRRVGRMLYRTACPSCQACEPIRVVVQEFQPTRSQRRVRRRNADVTVSIGPARFDEERLALYNRHKLERGLSTSGQPMRRLGYEAWFVRTCTRTVEFSYRVDGRLAGVSILDLGARDASSVYFFFDPDEHRRSLGVFSVLTEVEWMRRAGGRYYYLGLYVADCRHLSYKANYHPHERRVGGVWVRAPVVH